MQETQVRPLDREDPLEEGMAIHSIILLENPMDRGAWWATVHRVAKSWIQLERLSTHSYLNPNPGSIHKIIQTHFTVRAPSENPTESVFDGKGDLQDHVTRV